MTKPALLITVRLPEPVKARAAQAFEVRFATTDIPRTGSAIADLAHGVDAILTSTIERLDAATIAALPDSAPSARSAPATTISTSPPPGRAGSRCATRPTCCPSPRRRSACC